MLGQFRLLGALWEESLWLQALINSVEQPDTVNVVPCVSFWWFQIRYAFVNIKSLQKNTQETLKNRKIRFSVNTESEWNTSKWNQICCNFLSSCWHHISNFSITDSSRTGCSSSLRFKKWWCHCFYAVCPTDVLTESWVGVFCWYNVILILMRSRNVYWDMFYSDGTIMSPFALTCHC